ncbi:MAG: S41 family peptidase [Anaerolineales bacterium]|jgi:carboxyl-terminal processing protease
MKSVQRFFGAHPAPGAILTARSIRALFDWIMLLLAFSLVLAGCAGEVVTAPASTPNPTATIEAPTAPSPKPKPMPTIPTTLTAAERAAIFDAAWQTVNDKYFDPTFGGKDWQAIGDEYRQKLATVQDDHTFWLQVLNPMLFELGVSHIFALPGQLANQMQPDVFVSGSAGMDVRLLDGEAVITSVAEGSPAGQAGLQPGFVMTAVDGRTLEDFIAADLQTPPENERHRRGTAISGMRTALLGDVGAKVVVEYLDADDQPQRAVLQLAPRDGLSCDQLDPALPSACAEIEVKRLANGTGYLRFSGFLKPVLEDVLSAIDDLHDAPALIIDLRGNPGGEFPVRKAIASKLVGKPELFMRYQRRDGLEEVYLDPVPDPYTGEVVILVDELSASSSEEFTGSLQALNRAMVIGSQTPGSCLVMNIEPLPKGAILAYPYGQSQTPDGRILENNGVVPDVEVALDRQLLLQGIDAQLQAAIEYASEKIGK